MHLALLLLATFAASTVEMVEALTILLAVGVTRGWRDVAYGAGLAVACLAVVVTVLGTALTHLPIDTLRLVIGGLLLVFGLQWLRKAILRASGLKALHDEEAIYQRELAELAGARRGGPTDWYGLEVAFIVVTFGRAQGHLELAALAALAALIAVGVIGAVVHRPLSQVPENTLKFGVGVMLTAFGMFWANEGVGTSWPGGDVFILALMATTVAASLAAVRLLRRRALPPLGALAT